VEGSGAYPEVAAIVYVSGFCFRSRFTPTQRVCVGAALTTRVQLKPLGER
jgi:hypothetical protein